MRYFSKSALLAALMFLALAGVAACDDGNPVDGDGDVECPDGPADQWGNCPDGGPDGDGDTDSDSDGDVETVTLTISTWTIGPDGVERELLGAGVELRSDSWTCSSTPCDLEGVTYGEHLLILTLPGWIQAPIHLAVTQDGVELRETNPAFSAIVRIADRTISVRMERDLTGRWWNDEYGDDADITMYPPPEEYISVCPNSVFVAGRFFTTALCVEGETVSLCTTYDQACYNNGLSVVTGAIEEGVIDFSQCNIYDSSDCAWHTYTRVD
jgi:hypothetical protein